MGYSQSKNIDFSALHMKLYDMMEIFDRICRMHNIGYIIAYGTLLGAVRERKIIDWDDDIDIYMDTENLAKLKRVFRHSLLKIDFRDHIWRINRKDKDYPYIDIFEMKREKDRYLFVEEENRKRWNDYLLLDDVFPIRYYSLGRLTLPGPANYHSILTRNYGNYMIPVWRASHQ